MHKIRSYGVRVRVADHTLEAQGSRLTLHSDQNISAKEAPDQQTLQAAAATNSGQGGMTPLIDRLSSSGGSSAEVAVIRLADLGEAMKLVSRSGNEGF